MRAAGLLDAGDAAPRCIRRSRAEVALAAELARAVAVSRVGADAAHAGRGRRRRVAYRGTRRVVDRRRGGDVVRVGRGRGRRRRRAGWCRGRRRRRAGRASDGRRGRWSRRRARRPRADRGRPVRRAGRISPRNSPRSWPPTPRTASGARSRPTATSLCRPCSGSSPTPRSALRKPRGPRPSFPSSTWNGCWSRRACSRADLAPTRRRPGVGRGAGSAAVRWKRRGPVTGRPR